MNLNYVRMFVHINVLNLNTMLTTTISSFRRDIKKYLDKVTENFETLIINRGKDNGVVIFQKDNPSGLPENDDAREISIFFK